MQLLWQKRKVQFSISFNLEYKFLQDKVQSWKTGEDCGLSQMHFSRHSALFHICLSIQCTLLAVGGGLGAFEEAKLIHAYISNGTATNCMSQMTMWVGSSLIDRYATEHSYRSLEM
jgi:putative Mn2+ efflux pump MntP